MGDGGMALGFWMLEGGSCEAESWFWTCGKTKAASMFPCPCEIASLLLQRLTGLLG